MTTADELKAAGNKAFGTGKYQEAAEIYANAITLSQSPVLYSNRAQCFINLKLWDKALQDVENGLKLNPDDKMKVKLLYRGGVICQNTSNSEQATVFLRTALDIEPSNKQVGELLDKIKSNKKVKLATEANMVDIPIEVCDKLPLEYQQILNPSLQIREQTQELPSTSARASEEIDKLFPRKKTQSRTSLEQKPQPNFVKMPAMVPLGQLKSFPPEKKANSYKFVLSSPISTFQGLFDKGIEAEFLSFFMEAAVFASNNDIIQDWPNQVLLHLQEFCKYPGFELNLQFCEQQDLKQLLANVDKLGVNSLSSKYHSILDIYI